MKLPKEFKIPVKLGPVDAINCSKYIMNAEANSEFIYDFSNVQHCHPYGLLLLGNAIRSNRKRFKHSTHTLWEGDTQGFAFAADIGFFQYAGWDIGRAFDVRDYGARHIPIKKITIPELQGMNPEEHTLGNLVDLQAADLAYTLTQDRESPTTETLQYCLREMIRNTFEHAKTESVWVCGQYWPSRNEAEIALLDEGCGIYGSLRSNRRYKLNSDEEANKLALQPGASRMFGRKQDPNDEWQNSGYGLYMASAICAMGGYFILSSGKDATLINSDQQANYEANIRGTAICMNIRTDCIDDLQTQLSNLSKLGSENAKQHKKERILTASKVSTIASLIHKLPEEKIP